MIEVKKFVNIFLIVKVIVNFLIFKEVMMVEMLNFSCFKIFKSVIIKIKKYMIFKIKLIIFFLKLCVFLVVILVINVFL